MKTETLSLIHTEQSGSTLHPAQPLKVVSSKLAAKRYHILKSRFLQRLFLYLTKTETLGLLHTEQSGSTLHPAQPLKVVSSNLAAKRRTAATTF
ncbi:hypothetical protein [Gynuella sp.]|uniref:hypothetical protein n=1 Tax=Gynuella sp. TaxID=2969146 RepID=UPI003D0BB052